MRWTVAMGVCAVAACLGATSAQAADVTSAAEELKQGYILKLGGNCGDAIRHFVASYRLDPRPKAVLNLADCERQTGDLLAARGHATEGRELARRQNASELVGVAEEQLAALEKQLPQLTIHLAAGSPESTQIVLDRTVVGPEAFGKAAASNPGGHRIIVTAPGHLDREFEVTLVDGARQVVEVEPGPVLANVRSTVPTRTTPFSGNGPNNRAEPTRRILTYGSFGIGAVGVGLGVIAGIASGSKHGTLERECTGNNCPSSAQSDIDSFRSLRTWSTVGYVVGFVGLAGGAVLLLTAPRAVSDTSAHVWIGPASTGLVGWF